MHVTGRRMLSCAAVLALGASMLALPTTAFGDNEAGQAGSGANGSGVTALKLVTADGGGEKTESDDNVSFTFPSTINYVISADGTLTGPSSDVTYIGNSSVFPIHVSSVKATETGGWHFVGDIASAGSQTNSVELNLGPDAAGTRARSINIANFVDKTAGVDNLPASVASAWGMAPDGRVDLAAAGGVANVTQDITSATQFGTVQWYIKAGPAS